MKKEANETYAAFLLRFAQALREEYKQSDLTAKQFSNMFIYESKETYELTWDDVAIILNFATDQDRTGNAYRIAYRDAKMAYRMSEMQSDIENDNLNQVIEEQTEELNELLLEIKKEKVKLSDERTQNNAYIRRMSREETLKDIAADVADKFSKTLILPKYAKAVKDEDCDKEGLLILSDWHYGIEIENHWNVYNPDIAKMRVGQLLEETIELVREHKLDKVVVVNLGDLISGRIHNTIRIANRIDVITQTIEASELLAEFLNELSAYTDIDYYDTSDNHSRLEPNLSDSLDMESMTRVLTEFLKLRLKDNERINIKDNYYSDDIVNFELAGHNCAGVHGHHDKPQKVINNLSMLTQESYDLIISAHYHHFNADEQNCTVRVGNGSLMGTDDYAMNLRLNSEPSQTFIIATPENVVASIHKINLN